MKTIWTAIFSFLLIILCANFASAQSTTADFPMEWVGEYGGNSSYGITDRNLEIEITDIAADGTIQGIASITPSPKAPDSFGVTGSYRFDGTIDLKTKKIRFHGTEWIMDPIGENADSFVFLSFRGNIDDGEDLRIAGTTNYGFFRLAPKEPTEPETVSFAPPASVVKASGSARDVALSAAGVWTLAVDASAQSWLTVQDGAGTAGTKISGSGIETFQVLATENTDSVPRTGTITLTRAGEPDHVYKVTQQGSAQSFATIRRVRYYTNDTEQGGRLIGAQTIRNGMAALLADEPVRDGYDFLGWDTGRDAIEPTYQREAEYAFRADTTLYAIWAETPQETVVVSHVVRESAEEESERAPITRTLITSTETASYQHANLVADFDVNTFKQTLVARDGEILSKGVRRNPDIEGCNMKINGKWVQTVNCVWFMSMKLNALLGEENPGRDGWEDGQVIGDYRVTVIDPEPKFVFRDAESTPEAFLAMLGLDGNPGQDVKIVLYVNGFGHTFLVDAIVAQTARTELVGTTSGAVASSWRVYYTDNQPATKAIHTETDIEVYDMTMEAFLEKSYTVERAVVLTREEAPATTERQAGPVKASAGNSASDILGVLPADGGGHMDTRHGLKTGFVNPKYVIPPDA